MSKPKFDRNYARRKLELVLRDLRDYTADEFWREISRIARGATGLPSAEQVKEHAKKLEAINLGLAKTLVEMAAEKATLAEALESAKNLIANHSGEALPDKYAGDQIEQIDAALAAYRKQGGEQ